MGTQIKLVDSTGRIKGQVKDSKGMVTSQTDINGQVGFGYDDLDRLTSLKVTGETSSTFGYDDNSARTAFKQPNDVNTAYAYDDAGKLASLETSTSAGVKLLDQTYQYIDDFNISTETISGQTQTYEYDAAGQLTKWTNASGVETTYTYDASGNMTKAGPRTMAYDTTTTTTTNELSAMVFGADLYSFDYDERGNLTSASNGTDTTTYVWTGGNRLASISSPDTTAAFTYDAEGKRLTKTINGATTQFVYDDIKLIAEKDASGAVTAQYIYDDSGQLISMKKGGDTYYFHLNHRGDVMKITDASETVVAAYSYDPWGNILSSNETSVSQPFRYASYYWDSEIGMYYLINRYYDPSVGRFISKDPASDPEDFDLDPATANPYAYSDNNPVMGSDPDGLYWDGNPSYHRLLYYGSQGEDVRQLQIALRRVDQIFEIWINNHGGADGIFGAATALVVETYQKGFGLAVDRIVGPQTWGSLVSRGYLRGCPAFAPSQSPAASPAPQPSPSAPAPKSGAPAPAHPATLRISFPHSGNSTDYLVNVLKVNAKYASEHRGPVELLWFYNMVRGGQPWDLKLAAPQYGRYGRDKAFLRFRSGRISPDAFGNIHYGYVGHALLIPLTTLLDGSFIAHIKDNGPKEISKEFNDHGKIRYGYNLYWRYGLAGREYASRATSHYVR